MNKAAFAWLAALIIALAGGGQSLADESSPVEKRSSYAAKTEGKTPWREGPDQRHWAYHDLAAFDQRFTPAMRGGGLAEAENGMLMLDIYSAENLDRPVEVKNWSLLIGTALNLPPQRAGQLLDMYVFGLATGDKILREDAVGGMVKLLTINHLPGSATAAGLEPSKALMDLHTISERQKVLVQIAYCEGILDGSVNDFFRPKELLTNAEAVSMLYRVINKYKIDSGGGSITAGVRALDGGPGEHWAGRMLKKSVDKTVIKAGRLKRVEEIILSGGTDLPSSLDKPIPVEKWRHLLQDTLGLPKDKADNSFLDWYTFGLSDGQYITRGGAAAGMVKLLHVAGLVEGRDATEKERSAAEVFSDYGEAPDRSKLAIAYAEGLISGYGDRTFKPGATLTQGEALALAVKIIEKYY